MRNSDVKDIILSICIPTYNRKDILLENIKEIEKKISPHENSVEMLIGNNGSTDGTLMELEQFKNIKIINLNENRGINPILLRLTTQAKGQYLWILGDDDFLVENIFDIVFKNIISNNLKHSYFLSGKVYISLSDLQKKKKISSKRQILNSTKISPDLIRKSGFISSHIVDRKDYLEGLLRSLNFNLKNSYATKYAYLYSHQYSKIIFHINEALLIGRIQNRESHFFNKNPNLTLKTFLFDEFDILQQIFQDNLLSMSNFWINVRFITSGYRIKIILRALFQKIKSLLISTTFLFFGLFLGLYDYLLIKLKLKKED